MRRTENSAIAALAALLLATTLHCHAVAQSVLDVSTLDKYLDPVANPLDQIISPAGTHNGAPLFEVSISQFDQQLHSQLPPTTVWGYNGLYPGPTFEVDRGQEIYVRWTNDLRDNTGAALDHLLPYDTTVHGAGPMFPQARIVTHVHGAVTNEESDGFPEHWVSPDANAPGNRFGGPAGNQILTWFPNNQRAATNWYHDHSMGITRLNVYAGMAGFYLIRDQEEDALGLPSGEYEVPLVFQDRSFYVDGQLFYPAGPGDIASPGEGDPLAGLPDDFPSEDSQVPMFLADANLVNGTVWPYMEVEPRMYRFRMLNGANSRFYNLSLEPQAGAASTDPISFHQIGTDSGLLSTRVERTSIDMSPADRVDALIDFSAFNPGDTILLRNSGPGARAGTTDEVMQIRVVDGPAGNDSLPDQISDITRYDPADAVRTRTLRLTRQFDEYGRQVLLLDDLLWTDANTEFVRRGDLEIWEFVNETGMSHPMHLHMDAFQVLDRTSPGGTDIPLEDYELGWEDTVTVGPRESLSIMVKFDQFTGTFVWHCHILEHEDLEMMRTFVIIPEPATVVLACLALPAGVIWLRRRGAVAARDA